MRITKVIREFMEEQLTNKRLAANKEARAEYDAKVKACAAEVEEIIAFAREQVTMTIAKHNMDLEVKKWGSPLPIGEAVVVFDRGYIKCAVEDDKLREEEKNRAVTQREALKNIELEMALGGAKDDLMRMLNEVQF